jgi:hypothetical protein
MAEDTVRRLFFVPPVAIARLGGSTTPMDAFDWVGGDPHTIAETRIGPAWTLDSCAGTSSAAARSTTCSPGSARSSTTPVRPRSPPAPR